MSEQLNHSPEAPIDAANNRPPTEYMQMTENLHDIAPVDERGLAHRPDGTVMSREEMEQVHDNQELIRVGLDDREVTGEKRGAFEAALAFAHSDEREHASGPDVREATGLTSGKLQELGYVSYADLEKDALKWDESRQAVEGMAHPTPQPKEAWRQEADEWKEQRQATTDHVDKLFYKAKLANGGQNNLDQNPELAKSLREQAIAQAEAEGYSVDHLKPRHVAVPRDEAAEARQSDLAAALRQHDKEVLTAQANKGKVQEHEDEQQPAGGEPDPAPAEGGEGTPQNAGTGSPEGAAAESPAQAEAEDDLSDLKGEAGVDAIREANDIIKQADRENRFLTEEEQTQIARANAAMEKFGLHSQVKNHEIKRLRERAGHYAALKNLANAKDAGSAEDQTEAKKVPGKELELYQGDVEAAPKNWRERFSRKFKGLATKLGLSTALAEYAARGWLSDKAEGFEAKKAAYYDDPEKGKRRRATAYAGAIGIALAGAAFAAWASTKGHDGSGIATEGFDGSGFNGDGSVEDGQTPGNTPEREDIPGENGVGGEEHPLAEQELRTLSLGESGDNPWNKIEAFLGDRGYLTGDEKTDTYRIDLVKDAVLEHNSLTEADARKLPVGYDFEIPLEVLEQLDKEKTESK